MAVKFGDKTRKTKFGRFKFGGTTEEKKTRAPGSPTMKNRTKPTTTWRANT